MLNIQKQKQKLILYTYTLKVTFLNKHILAPG